MRAAVSFQRSGPLKRKAPPPARRPVSPASPAQRAKIADQLSIVSGKAGCHPSHVVPRSLGGCDHPDCVVPLTPDEHCEYEEGRLDLLPYLIGGRVAELQHPLGHTRGDLLGLLHIVTGKRFEERRDP